MRTESLISCLFAISCSSPVPQAPAHCEVGEVLDLGDARVGSEIARTVTVTNPLSIVAEVLIGSPTAPFSVDTAAPLRLAPRESREVTLRFLPTRSGSVEGQWSCAGASVTLTGLAYDAPLSISPGRLDFGVLTSGVTRTLSLEVRNHTRTALAINSLTFSSAAFQSSTAMPVSIPANGAVEVSVDAQSTSSASVDGVLLITTEAFALDVPLLANRTAPCLVSSRPTLDFSAAELGCRSHDERLSLTNSCAHPVRLTGSTASPGFALISRHDVVLAPREGLDLAVSFGAQSLGALSGSITVSADVLDGTQVLSIPLSAAGTPALVVNETLTLPPRPQRDVLFLIDDSASMLPLAESVRRNLHDFARYAAVSGDDVRIGVMTTSTAPAELGHLRGWIDAPTPAALETLGAITGLATGRSSCLEVLLTAFSPPRSAALSGMLRANAGLQVACITKNRDGLETAPMPAISSVLSLLPERHVIGVVASFTHVPGCEGVLDHGPLAALVAQSNGRMEEICSPSWAITLDPSKHAFGYRTKFFLHQRPAFTRTPLRVFIDEVELPSSAPARVWEYSGVQNSVNFEPVYAPGPGRTLRFSFSPDCP